jgi:hypothetical protein
MEILYDGELEAQTAVHGHAQPPRFGLSAEEAGRLADACFRAGIRGKLLKKVQSISWYSAAKEWSNGREAVVRME